MRIEPWQIPVFVMAVLAVPVSLYYWVRDYLPRPVDRDQTGQSDPTPNGVSKSPARGWVRTSAWLVLTLLIIVLFWWALGSQGAVTLATCASAVSAVVAARFALQSAITQLSDQNNGSRQEPDKATQE